MFSCSLTPFLSGGLDPEKIPEEKNFDLIPPGAHPVIIDDAIIKPTKSGDGHLVEVALSIISGVCKGRKLWARFNIDNPSAECVRIGCSQLAGLARATGVGAFDDVRVLIRKSCVAHVIVKGEYNEIKKYEAYGDALSVQTPPAPAAPAPAPAPVQYEPAPITPNPGNVAQPTSPEAPMEPWRRPKQ